MPKCSFMEAVTENCMQEVTFKCPYVDHPEPKIACNSFNLAVEDEGEEEDKE